jgi:hypothetical protein
MRRASQSRVACDRARPAPPRGGYVGTAYRNRFIAIWAQWVVGVRAGLAIRVFSSKGEVAQAPGKAQRYGPQRDEAEANFETYTSSGTPYCRPRDALTVNVYQAGGRRGSN